MWRDAIYRNLAIGMAGAALTFSNLACLSGFKAVDETLFPEAYKEEQRQQEIDRWMGQFLDKSDDQLQPAPQGEFVAPVAPMPPAGAPPAPGAAPQAAVPGAPVILSTHFPSPIPADGQWHYGWIDFTDSGGDVTQLKIEIMWTTAPVKGPGATRDAEIEGPPTAGKVRMRFT